ncbi:hypothetical protein [Comamonas sp. MYb396]|uniref:hypothetical protein n=1 Tax=Comamonas sp. MYb396 TaxID=2745302 RepID=UPI00309964A4
MKKNVLSLSIQAMFGGFWDDGANLFREPASIPTGTPVKVRCRVAENSDDIMDFNVFLSDGSWHASMKKRIS